MLSLAAHGFEVGHHVLCFFNLFACFLRVRQEAGYDAEEWQEGTYLEDELDAGLVGEPSEEGGPQTAKTEHQSEEDTGDESELVGHEVGGIHHDGGERRSYDKS